MVRRGFCCNVSVLMVWVMRMLLIRSVVDCVHVFQESLFALEEVMKSIVSVFSVLIVLFGAQVGFCQENAEAAESGPSLAEISEQPSSNGAFMMRLTDVNKRNDVITVKAVVENVIDKEAEIEIDYENVYFLNLNTSKKYHALKDDTGQVIAGPADYESGGGRIDRRLQKGGKAILWLKFPAPVGGAKTIDLFFPDFMPFEGVPVEQY